MQNWFCHVSGSFRNQPPEKLWYVVSFGRLCPSRSRLYQLIAESFSSEPSAAGSGRICGSSIRPSPSISDA